MGIGTSIVLIALGAILAFGVVLDSTIGSTTVEWATIGWILMAVGVLGLIVSMVMISTARRREVVTRDRVIERDPISVAAPAPQAHADDGGPRSRRAACAGPAARTVRRRPRTRGALTRRTSSARQGSPDGTDLATGNLHTVWQHGGVVGTPSLRRLTAVASGSYWSGRPYTMPSDGSRMVDLLPGNVATVLPGLGRIRGTRAPPSRPRSTTGSTVVLSHGDRPVRHLSAACQLSARVEVLRRDGSRLVAQRRGGLPLPERTRHRPVHRRPRIGAGGPGQAPRTRRQNPRLPAWSPVADSLAFVGDGRLFVAPDRSGQPRLATTLVATSAPTWSADGGHVAAVVRDPGGRSVLAVAQLNGRGVATFASPSPALPRHRRAGRSGDHGERPAAGAGRSVCRRYCCMSPPVPGGGPPPKPDSVPVTWKLESISTVT